MTTHSQAEMLPDAAPVSEMPLQESLDDSYGPDQGSVLFGTNQGLGMTGMTNGEDGGGAYGDAQSGAFEHQQQSPDQPEFQVDDASSRGGQSGGAEEQEEHAAHEP